MDAKFQICLITILLVFGLTLQAQNSRKKFNATFDQGVELVETNLDRALELFFESYEIGKMSEDLWAMAIAKGGIGYANYSLGNYREAYLSYFDALEIFKKSDTLDLSNTIIVLNELSMIQSDFDNYDESIRYSEIALELAGEYVSLYPDHAKKNDQLKWLIEIPYYMSIEYQEKGDNEMAGEILRGLWQNIGDKGNIKKHAGLLNELGNVASNLAQYKDALKYYDLILNNGEVDGSDKSIALHNSADIYFILQDYDKAADGFLRALELKMKHNDTWSQFATCQDLGEVYFVMGRYDDAISNWKLALELHSELETPDLFEVYNWLTKAYQKLNKPELADSYHLLYNSKRDEFKNSAKWIKAEQERQDFREFLRNMENGQIASSTRKEYVILIVVLTIGAVSSTILVLAYRRKKRQSKLYKELGGILLDDDSDFGSMTK